MTRAFVTLASRLATGYDVVDLLSELTTSCAQLLDIASAGLLLADADGVLHVMAASSERTRQLEVFQLQRSEGPCRDCYSSGRPVSVPDLAGADGQWPVFAPAAVAAGFASLHALPLRLRDHLLGTLGLFGSTPGPLREEDLVLGQALADVASVALIQNTAALDRMAVTEQLQTALSSRVVLEQAKGVLAQRGELDMAQAFAVLRGFARHHNLLLTVVAGKVVSRELPAQLLLDHANSRRS